jgi:hypothetical protein
LPRSLHVKHGAVLFALDIAGYFPHLRSDSFLTPGAVKEKESINHLLGVILLFGTIIYISCMMQYVDGMLRRVTRINSVAKGTFGAELVARAIF